MAHCSTLATTTSMGICATYSKRTTSTGQKTQASGMGGPEVAESRLGRNRPESTTRGMNEQVATGGDGDLITSAGGPIGHLRMRLRQKTTRSPVKRPVAERLKTRGIWRSLHFGNG